MKKFERFLPLLLIFALIVSLAAGILLDPNTWTTPVETGNYQIQITEICTKNESVIADNSGKFRDYIELYNAGERVDLTGCYLTDGNTRSQPFENLILEKDSYRLLFLGKDITGFALSASGKDSILLKDPNGKIIAQTKLRSLLEDQVMILKSGTYQLSDVPTPGFPNDTAGRDAFLNGKSAKDSPLEISEVLISNRAFLPDEKGQYSDVVELHNISDQPLHLGGWCISDDFSQRFRYRLPEVTLPADGYALVFCDGENYVSSDGFIHANFSLNKEEELCLTDPNGAYQTMRLSYPGENTSLALQDGSYISMAPSLGFENTEEGCYNALASQIDENCPLVISELLLSDSGVPVQGALQDAVEIQNISDGVVNTKGWYLSDGGDPYACPLPTADLAPGDCIVVILNQETAGFGLSIGETVYLRSPEYKLSQPLECAQPEPGKSMSLLDAVGTFSYNFTSVTLGYPNDQDGEERFLADQPHTGLLLSEAMSSNSSYLVGPYRNTTDWVELYNAGTETIDLSGYYMTDSSNLTKYPLPEKSLEPGKYMVILLSESGKQLKAGYSHLPFNLSASGDRLYLTKDGQIVDFTILPELPSDAVWGRPKGKLAFTQLNTATPGSANAGKIRISATPTADIPQGSYDGIDSITITLNASGTIYYTTNCTVPTKSSKQYSGPITLTKTTVIRAVAYESGASRSEVLDLTYLINENDTLGAVCLVTEPDNLWSYTSGIYVKGPTAGATSPYHGANFWQNWEKEASVSLFETDGQLGFSEKCGLKIFGGFSRANGKKSLACMFRGKYGASSLDYALFGEDGINRFQSFVLRAGGQDAYTSRIRDELITSLAADQLNVYVQRYRPTVLYLNGEYWGIYFIREKLNDQYVAGNFGVYAEDVTLADWSGGNCPEYKALQNYAKNNDLSQQKHYDYICSQINVDNYIDYMITQMWIANTDLGNVKFFRTSDMPWHWALYDTDLSFRKVNHESVSYMLTRNIYVRDIRSATLLIRLMKNDTFREKFLRRTAWVVNNVWTKDNVIARIDELHDALLPDMQKECNRWLGTVQSWEKNIEDLRSFATNRTAYFLKDLKSYFGLTTEQMRSYGFEV